MVSYTDFPKIGDLAKSIFGVGLFGFGWWKLRFSSNPGGWLSFVLANICIPIGAILCWYGFNGILTWSVHNSMTPVRQVDNHAAIELVGVVVPLWATNINLHMERIRGLATTPQRVAILTHDELLALLREIEQLACPRSEEQNEVY